MLPHTCIPPPLAEISYVISYSDYEDEAVDPTRLEVKRACSDKIVFQTPFMAQVALELIRAEGKKPLT